MEALPTASEKGMKTCASYEMPMQVDAASVLDHVISVVESGELCDIKLHTSTQPVKNESDSSVLLGLCPPVKRAASSRLCVAFTRKPRLNTSRQAT